MSSCILTVIKNEHEYLNDWINYHLNLGVDYIFIFEDIDSKSHKEITDKYDNVMLKSVYEILNNDDINIVNELKLTKKYNIQEIYFPNGLLYIQKNYNYDWCFVIDVDEYITCDNLQNTLSLYTNYDAFILQWKVYGANGYIKKPNYNEHKLIDIFTKESDYIGHNKIQWTTKTCYNLKTFERNYFKECHQPSDYCKWCKTNFSHSRFNIIYDNIYIKHYMTKSWEEYISKRKRGYFMGFARTIDLFFKINPDMLIYKDQLLNELKEEILVIIPYKQSSAQGNEIKIALKGWRKFCQFKYHFIVIGEFDESLRDEFSWVEFINCPTLPKKENQYNPHLDIMNKFNIISRSYSQIYDGFIFTTDDEYPIKNFDLNNIKSIYYHASDFYGNKTQPTWYWNHDKWKTKQLLEKENLPHINYTIHYPVYYEFNKLKEICKKYNMLNESYVFEDIYFNYFSHEEPIIDNSIRLGIWNKMIYESQFQNAVNNPNIKFICNSINGWSKELENDLEKIVNV